MGKLRAAWILFVLVMGFSFPATALAQRQGKLAVKGGRVIPVTGEEIENGIVLIEEGKIKEVGRDVKIPYDAMVLDASEKTIFPGMVDSHSSLGLDIPNESLPVTPYVTVADAIDPSRLFFENALREGITSIHVIQGNNCVIGGLSQVVRPLGMMVPEMTVQPDVGLKISVSPRRGYDRMLQMATLRDAFRELGEYLEDLAEKKFEEKLKKEKKEIDVTPEEARKLGKSLIREGDLDHKHLNLARLVEGRLMAFVYCGSAMDVSHGVEVAKENGFFDRTTLILGAECFKAVKEVKEAGRPLILAPDLVHREEDPFTGEEKETFVPAVYAEEGIPFALLPDPESSFGEQFLWYQAARCVRNGVPRETALKAITLYPAAATGMEKRLGSIEPGKDGNLLILSGDPLLIQTHVEKVIIEGTVVYEREKDIRLKRLIEGEKKEESKGETEVERGKKGGQ